jgi:hypothetical protein
MLTYTFILQFKEGMYISQVNGNNLKHGVDNWARSLNTNDIKHFGKQSQIELIGSVSHEVPTAISGIANVWCLSISLGVGFVIVNIVQTDVSGFSM